MTPEASDSTPYYQLDPDTVISAIESAGFLCDGRLLALNSYENRVYQVGLEEGDPVVAKFYRPARWSDDQILEEHTFSLELAEAEIPLVPPMVIDGATLHHHRGFRFAVFERRGGHAPELDQRDTRLWLGRFLGRIHAVGAGPHHTGAVTVRDLPATSVVVLSGLDLNWGDGPTQEPASAIGLTLLRCDGPVRVQECRIAGWLPSYGEPGKEALHAEDCSDIVVSGCELVGGYGGATVASAEEGSPAAKIVNSSSAGGVEPSPLTEPSGSTR